MIAVMKLSRNRVHLSPTMSLRENRRKAFREAESGGVVVIIMAIKNGRDWIRPVRPLTRPEEAGLTATSRKAGRLRKQGIIPVTVAFGHGDGVAQLDGPLSEILRQQRSPYTLGHDADFTRFNVE